MKSSARRRLLLPFNGNDNDNNNGQTTLFVWEIAVNFYSFHKQMTHHLQTLEEQRQQQQQQRTDEEESDERYQSQQHPSLPNYTDYDNSTTTKAENDVIVVAEPFLPWIRRSEKYVEQVLPPRIIKLIDDAWEQVVSITTSNDNDRGGGNGDANANSGAAAAAASNTVPTDKAAAATTTTKNNSKNGGFVTGFLHIRRGDTQHECDTSIPKLRKYLNCSLNTMRLKQVKRRRPPNKRKSDNDKNNTTNRVKLIDMILLVSTNEQDPSYVKSVQKMISNELSPLRVVVDHSIVDDDESPSEQEIVITKTTTTTTTTMANIIPINAEELVWSTLRRSVRLKEVPKSYLNNFHAFLILQQLKDRVHVKLQQRRVRQCKDCDDVGEVVVVC